MNAASYRIVVLAVLLSAGVFTYRVAFADDDTGLESRALRGTYLIYTESNQHAVGALVDPSVTRIGDTSFLVGQVPGNVTGESGGILKATAFSGRSGYVAIHKITSMLQIHSEETGTKE